MEIIAKSDIGMKRQKNEDSYYIKMIEDDIGLYIVADGLGGYNGGEIASEMLTRNVSDYLEPKAKWLRNASDEKIEFIINQAIMYANENIYNLASSDEEYQGMGTTVSLLFKIGNRIFYVSVGDSRIYHLDSNFKKMEQVTTDDTYVNELIKTNIINEDEAKSHPQKHILTKAVGVVKSIDVEVKKLDINDGYFILCTDGVSNMLTDEEIVNIFKTTKFDDVASNIIVRANENGGVDNITVVVVKL